MDPVSFAALLTLGGKAIDAGVALVKLWREPEGGGVAVGADGSKRQLHSYGPAGRPMLAGPVEFGFGDPVEFEGEFVAKDEWAQAYLVVGQPVLVVIEDLTPYSRLDTVVAVVGLGDPFEGSLYPGNYQLGAFVFLDELSIGENSVEWEDLDGGAIIEFSVADGDPPFRLEVPIEAVEVPAVELVLQDRGFLNPGYEEQYVGNLQANIDYRIRVLADIPEADFDVSVYDENGNLVAHDVDPESDAISFITPRWTGPFTIVVECHDASSGYEILVESVAN